MNNRSKILPMEKIVLFLLILSIGIDNVNAQSSNPQIVSSAGETFQGNSLQIDWTLGELAITTIQNSSQQITQGFHQPTFVIMSIDELSQKIGQIQVFPNPASDIIEVKANFDQSRNVMIQLVNLNGSLLWMTKNNGDQIDQVKDITNLPSGTYFLNFLIDGNKYSQTFKIQKIN